MEFSTGADNMQINTAMDQDEFERPKVHYVCGSKFTNKIISIVY